MIFKELKKSIYSPSYGIKMLVNSMKNTEKIKVNKTQLLSTKTNYTN